MTNNVVLSIICFSLLIALIGYLRGGKQQVRAKEKGSRHTLVSRMKQGLGPPILCPKHAKHLEKGQLAVIDALRCQKCTPPPKIIIKPLPDSA